MGMSLFKKKEENWDKVHSAIKVSFNHVKRDTTTLFEWIKFLNKQIEQQQHFITQLDAKLGKRMLAADDIREIINNHFAIKNAHQLHERFHKLTKKVDILSAMHDAHNLSLNELYSLFEKTKSEPARKSTSFKEKLAKKLTTNSKKYIKNTILGYIEKYTEVSALQLKEMLVEEQNLCSKSSFYRLLDELEAEEKVTVAKDGRQKLYAGRQLKAHQEH